VTDRMSASDRTAHHLLRLGDVSGIEIDVEALHRYIEEIVEAAALIGPGDTAMPPVAFAPNPEGAP